MVEPKSGIARPAIAHVVAKGIERTCRVDGAECVGPSLSYQAIERVSRLRLD